MRDQKTLALAAGFETYSKTTRRSRFLEEMDRVVPWLALCQEVEAYYPKAGKGRHPVGLERMLRIYFLQQWFDLSDPGVEEALYDSLSMRTFVGIDLGREPVPDETTVCKFRHLLEKNNLGKKLFEAVNEHLASLGLKVSRGTIVDATILAAPSSTKNAKKERDPEMHQTKKGNAWHFGMKMHIGVDSKLKLIHSVETTAANVHDSQVVDKLLHGAETKVWGDSAYSGQQAKIRAVAKRARCLIQAKAVRNRPLTEEQKATNRNKSRVRAKGEHPFHVIKRVFGFAKVRYRGLAKNTHRVLVTCALANLFMMRGRILRLQGA
jgi:transposase, IS5 family